MRSLHAPTAFAGRRPASPQLFTGRFNELVYLGLVYFEEAIYLMCVDDAIRWTVLWVTDLKDWESLERSCRRSWICQYGPPRRVRSDKESALAGDAFGAFCEKYGIIRELVLVKDQHGPMSVLDRRVQIFRDFAPRLLDSLAESQIELEPEDVAAEAQIMMNTQLSYAGMTSYQCLFGQGPNET